MEEIKRKMVLEGFALLQKNKHYTQINVINKLKTLGVSVSPTTFNRLLKNKKVGQKNLFEVSDAIVLMVYKELGYEYDKSFIINKEATWEMEIIPETKEGVVEEITGFKFHEDGRLTIEEKVAFLSTAKKEIIELGVTLNSFTSYFLNRKDAEFKDPILQLLDKGVTIKCYLLNPNSNEALHYFNDRKMVLPEEANGVEKIKGIIPKLKSIQTELNEEQSNGSFEVYTYKHIPNNHFLSIDGGDRLNGKMMVSHYLYGERRAKCPAFEFTRKDNRSLYLRYWNSLKHVIKDASRI